eukprot:2393679-Rhodomonas_salina.1
MQQPTNPGNTVYYATNEGRYDEHGQWYNRNERDEWFDALYTEVPNPMEANNANANTQGTPASAPTSNAESTPPAPNANQP